MRRRYIQIKGELVEVSLHPDPILQVQVMPDLKPYKSMITGEVIKSRSHHREHLKQHGCQELGNEIVKQMKEFKYEGIPDVNPQGRKELIRSQISALTHKEFKAAIKRDVDRVKWKSNY